VGVNGRGSRRVLLVRHGESVWNADGRWQGQADPPLSVLGREQAHHAAAAIGRFDALWSSDLARARVTAGILAVPLHLPVWVDARLRERGAGEWTGLTRSEIEARFPGALEARRSPPGFEPDDALRDRTLAALGDIVDELEPGGDALAVTHGGVIRTLERFLGVESEPVPNLGGRWFTAGADASYTLGSRELLVDPAAVVVTVPRQL
jgi:broad specificity phosphatase PhoE